MSAEVKSQNILESITDSDLDPDDREPIHVPNLIQPHGVLLAISIETERIVQVSMNTQEILSLEPEELLGQSLTEFLGEQQALAVKKCLSADFEHINPLPIELTAIESVLHFDGIVHRQAEIIVLELEPRLPTQKASFDNFYRFVQNPLKRLQKTENLEELCTTLAQEIKAVTEFDRVMVYRLDRDGAGSVIAEAVESELEPFLGLHYPATDIPKQAKYLYTLNLLRIIPDLKYEPVKLFPDLNPLSDRPLDLSMAVLRGISPCHIEYLHNMGVAATMCISLVKDGQLWGLIACHHNSPKKVDYQTRTICEFIGQIVASELTSKENSQDSDYKIKLKSIQSEFVASLSQTEDLEVGLTQNPQKLLDLVGAAGVALSFGSGITTFGNTPSKSAIKGLLPWLATQFDRDIIYETNGLAQSYPEASDYADVASGLMALLVSRVDKTFIIWFRPEVKQTVDWGGNPYKTAVRSDGTLRMSPRKSFAKWQEVVRENSLPWKACEVEAALELRSSIVGIVLRKADELALINKELSRSNVELDAFAYIASHDLKEPLRGIYNYSSFLIEDYGQILGSDGADKLNTLMRLAHRMEDLINSLLHYSRLGRAELLLKSVDLNNLLAGVLDVIKVSARDTQVEFKIPRPLPTIKGDRTQIEELLTNLISNGIKYNQKQQKTIEIGYLDPDDPIAIERGLEYSADNESKTVFYVRDNGIGIRERHLDSIFRIFKRLHGPKKYGGGTGAGLTIAQKIVERHGGEIWIESVYTRGSTFYFTLE